MGIRLPIAVCFTAFTLSACGSPRGDHKPASSAEPAAAAAAAAAGDLDPARGEKGNAEPSTPNQGNVSSGQREPKVVTVPVEVSFAAEDGLEITADVYRAYDDDQVPFVVLFHQAGWSRGEYREIAPRLNALGFNCMAVDQRSGGEVNGVVNQTARRAAAKKMGMTYLDALPDLRAALGYARTHYTKGKVIGWGSSYSSALVLWLAGEEPGLMDAVLSFAPGEYFARFGKTKTFVESAAKKISIPAFVTSAKDEASQWAAIYEAIPAQGKARYLPSTSGNHGSRALWSSFDDSPGYWGAVEGFLAKLE